MQARVEQTLRDVVRDIRNFWVETGLAPSYQDLATRLSLSMNQVRLALDYLETWELITRDPRRKRSIKLVHDVETTLKQLEKRLDTEEQLREAPTMQLDFGAAFFSSMTPVKKRGQQ